jgi:hypothetical protein
MQNYEYLSDGTKIWLKAAPWHTARIFQTDQILSKHFLLRLENNKGRYQYEEQ